MTESEDDGYPIPVGMSDQEFKVLYKLWSSSYDDPKPPRRKNKHSLRLNKTAKSMKKPAGKPKVDGRKETYFQKGMGTLKAQFFITKDGPSGTFGFWLPKSAIIETGEFPDGEKFVNVADWCGVEIICFT